MKHKLKLKDNILRLIALFALGVLNGVPAFGQATINCPSNITVNNASNACGATVNYSAVTASCSGGSGTTTLNYNYTGGVQTFTVPAGVTSLSLQAWGGQGRTSISGNATGGRGGYATGTLAVTPGQLIRIYVGGGGGVSFGTYTTIAEFDFMGGLYLRL